MGVDFGTLSRRVIMIRVCDGRQLRMVANTHSRSVLDRALPSGLQPPPDWAMQVPHDYIDVLHVAMPEVLRKSGVRAEDVSGIGTDLTGCPKIATPREASLRSAQVRRQSGHVCTDMAPSRNLATSRSHQPTSGEARRGRGCRGMEVLSQANWNSPKALRSTKTPRTCTPVCRKMRL